MDVMRNRIRPVLDSLRQWRYSLKEELTEVEIRPGDYHFSETLNQDQIRDGWMPFGSCETWGGRDRHFWFRTRVVIKREWEGKEVRVTLNTGADDIWNTDNPQIMAYKDGILAGTMDMNHQDLILTEKAQERGRFELVFYAYSNSENPTNFFHLTAAVYDREIAGLYYDLKVPFEAAELLSEENLDRIEVMKFLNTAISGLDLRKPGSEEFFRSVKEVREYVKKNLPKICRSQRVTVHSIGHTHIDVAWKWPLRQTRQKAVRSFRTVLNLMEQYPEYKFMSSQPQLYEFVREEAPELFEKIREKIQEGRWEAEGGMWLEPDCNLASGESLIRHILYGKRFFEKELGAKKQEVLWLPDVFGYSAAMPQIMKKAGLSYFMTTKLGWNEYNVFPYDTFMWKGIDGSQVLTHLITTRNYLPGCSLKDMPNGSTTYNGLQNPSQIKGTWQRYQNKETSSDVLTCYGYGDGGGGPTEEMLEQSRRMEEGVAGVPRVHQTFAKDFFHILEDNMDRKCLPSWCGELYLEFHRGTYTSQAKNKKYNRACEFLMGDAEFYSVLAKVMGAKYEYPAKDLEKNWKLLLINQFHDILPGSSIKDVYEDSAVQNEEIIQSAGRIVNESQSAVLSVLEEENKKECLAVFNPLSFGRTSVAELSGEEAVMAEEYRNGSCPENISVQKTPDGSTLFLIKDAPSKGIGVYEYSSSVRAEEEPVITSLMTDERGWPVSFDTPFFHMEFDGQGEICGIRDLREDRELLKKGAVGNELLVYEDRPMEFDAWNIDAGYREKKWKFGGVMEFYLEENGPVRGCLFIRRRFMDSVLEQKICFYPHTSRIDFKTKADWNESQLLLRTSFPLDIQSSEADFEIQFGNVKRPVHKNTTWDQARFEVCAHKWMDLSEYGYGAAILNDCKYGCDIHDSVMSLTLIKSGIFPDPQADQGLHEFTYSLYPHRGDFRRGGVIREAYDLNCPLIIQRENGIKTESWSFLRIAEENIFTDTVKKAEEGDDLIIRLYEAYGMRTRVHLELPLLPDFEAAVCDLMEQTDLKTISFVPETELCRKGQTLEFEMKPYEIFSIRLTPKVCTGK
ncbi:alpha-mannosidase [Enterocloster clostridioformis]|uniref:alpha-mannosidase n=1 Tax=Enterocloster clostridioformis TaxID=1531 RepID=UPI0032195C15